MTEFHIAKNIGNYSQNVFLLTLVYIKGPEIYLPNFSNFLRT